jgi:hypothetical protein
MSTVCTDIGCNGTSGWESSRDFLAAESLFFGAAKLKECLLIDKVNALNSYKNRI